MKNYWWAQLPFFQSFGRFEDNYRYWKAYQKNTGIKVKYPFRTYYGRDLMQAYGDYRTFRRKH